MSEKITAIEERHDVQRESEWSKQDGFRIATSMQEIWLGIDNSQSCCENWGYLLSEDDPQKFVGAELRGIVATDTNRTSRTIKTVYGWQSDEPYDDDAVYLDAGDAVFIDLETDRGILQFVAYNGHNGYYGHNVTVESHHLLLEKTL